MDVDPIELSKLSTNIIQTSTKLGELKAQRDELNKQIAELDKELRPAILKQQQMMAVLMGDPIPVPLSPNQPQAQPQVWGGPGDPAPFPANGSPAPSGGNTALKQRVVEFLRKCDESVSATDIAEALHIDPALVREAMLDLRRR